jgi:hypothetical protein
MKLGALALGAAAAVLLASEHGSDGGTRAHAKDLRGPSARGRLT